jgi:hypothetical protein
MKNNPDLKDSTLLSAIGIIMAGGMVLSPSLQSEFKVIGAIAGFGISADLSIKDRKSHESKMAEQKRIRDELNLKALQIEHDQGKLEQDLEAIASIRAVTETELAILKDNQIAEIIGLEQQMLQKLESDRLNLTHEMNLSEIKQRELILQIWVHVCNKIADYSGSCLQSLQEIDAEIKERSRNADSSIKNSRWQLARQVKGLRSRIYFKKQREQAIAVQQLEMAADDAGEQIKAIYDTSIVDVTAYETEEIAKIDAQTDEGNEAYMALANDHKKAMNESIKLGYTPAFAEMHFGTAPIGEELRRNYEQIEVLQGKLAAIAKPKFCPYKNRAGEKANEFIRFVHEAMNLKLVWISSLILAGDCLQVDFELHDSEDKAKAIAKLQKDQNIEALCVSFGSDGVIIVPNPVDHCWRATIPANEGYQGNDEVYQVSEVADDLEEGLRQQMNLSQTEEFMLNFTPVVPLFPRVEISGLSPCKEEWATLNWFFFWRLEATGKANIVSVIGLMREVYGVSEVAGRAINPVTGESLSDRLERLLPQLKAEYAQLVSGVKWD